MYPKYSNQMILYHFQLEKMCVGGALESIASTYHIFEFFAL